MANASNTIESIKRQLQNMKTQKEDAFDRAEKADAKLAELLDRRSKVNTANKFYFSFSISFVLFLVFSSIIIIATRRKVWHFKKNRSTRANHC